MKTITSIIMTFLVLSLPTAAFAQTQMVQSTGVAVTSESSLASATAPSIPAPPTVPAPSQNVFQLTEALSYVSRPGGGDMVLVIPSGQTKTEELIAINEDMNIMSRIFEKNLQKASITPGGPGILLDVPIYKNLFSVRGNNLLQSMYLQDYGALFLMKVDFPLSASPDAREQENEIPKAQDGDSVWQQTRQQMFEPEKFDRKHRIDRPEAKYDPDKVENLKTTLIKTLKHAANIRALKPDESVILTVAGGGQPAGTTITAINVAGNNQVIVEEKSADGKSKMRIVKGNALDDIGLSSPIVLVIRAKKSRIDAFSKGELDFDKFRQSVQMFSYPCLGGVKLRGDSFNQYIDLPRSTGSINIQR